MSESSPTPQPLGQLLKQAGLLSEAQIQIALSDQARQQDLLFGEIVVLRGWLKAQTLEFFLKHFVTTFQSLSETEMNHMASSPSGCHRIQEDLSQFYSFAPPTSERIIPTAARPVATPKTSPATGTSSQAPPVKADQSVKSGKSSPGKLHIQGFCIQAEEEDEELIEEEWSDLDLSAHPRQG